MREESERVKTSFTLNKLDELNLEEKNRFSFDFFFSIILFLFFRKKIFVGNKKKL